MIARHWNFRLARLLLVVSVLATAGWLAARPAAAAKLDKLDTSLKLIPADAAFYGSMLRNREQIEAILHSNAWAKIMKMPAVQMGLAAYRAQVDSPDSELAKVDAVLKNPEIQKILGLLADMGSDEVFIYGDKNFVDFVELFQKINGAQSLGPLEALLGGKTNPMEMDRVQKGAMMSALAKNLKLFGVPNLIVGFKLKNADLAKEELIKLEMFANMGLESFEQTKGHFKKTKVGGHEYLVLSLDGEMIPWDGIPTERFSEMEAEEGDAQKIIDRLKESKFVVAVGVRDNYLLVSIGRSLECLEKLGKGPRLIDRAEFKPLEKYVDKRLVGVGYMSAALNRQADGQKKNIDNLLAIAQRWLASAELADEQKERIRKDVQELAKDAKQMIPEAGAVMGMSFICDRGFESYQFAWGGHGRLDGSKPLSLLKHVGGYPILGVVARQKPCTVKEYDRAVKWAKTAYGYFKEFGLPAMKDADREKIEKFLDAALPLVDRMDKANRELLIPALADGQFALVIDAKLTSKRFIASLPETEKPMPMLEPAIVLGISDADLFKKGLGEYREVVNGLIDAVRQIEGVNLPEGIQIPEPQTTEDSDRTIYSFTLPDKWGVDEKIEPNIGISDKVAVFSASRGHTERLLRATPFSIGGELGNGERPLAGAVWFHWAALVEAAAPWADFVAQAVMLSQDVEEAQRKPIADQVHTVLDVLKALRSISDESYFENGALVNHTLTEVHDVGK
jgi:hypothetical protein